MCGCMRFALLWVWTYTARWYAYSPLLASLHSHWCGSFTQLRQAQTPYFTNFSLAALLSGYFLWQFSRLQPPQKKSKRNQWFWESWIPWVFKCFWNGVPSHIDVVNHFGRDIWRFYNGSAKVDSRVTNPSENLEIIFENLTLRSEVLAIITCLGNALMVMFDCFMWTQIYTTWGKPWSARDLRYPYWLKRKIKSNKSINGVLQCGNMLPFWAHFLRLNKFKAYFFFSFIELWLSSEISIEEGGHLEWYPLIGSCFWVNFRISFSQE